MDPLNPFQNNVKPQVETPEVNIPKVEPVKLKRQNFEEIQPNEITLPGDIIQMMTDKGIETSDVKTDGYKEPINQNIETNNISTSQPVMPSGNIQINQRFGNPNSALYGPGGYNRGVDIAAQPGELQSAPKEGNWVVKEVYTGSGFNTGWGRSVVIQNTQTGETIRRSHLDKVLVKPGDVVTGRTLGTTGRTGRTTGYHKDVEYTNRGQLSDYTKSPYFKYEGS